MRPDGAWIPQWYEQVPVEVTARIRARSTAFGVPVVMASVVLAVLIVALRDVPSTSDDMFHVGAVFLGGMSALLSFCCGLALTGARSQAKGNLVNMTRLAGARRLSAGLWGLTLGCTLIAWFIEFMSLRTADLPLSGGVVVYGVLLALPAVVGFVAFRVTSGLVPSRF